VESSAASDVLTFCRLRKNSELKIVMASLNDWSNADRGVVGQFGDQIVETIVMPAKAGIHII
jgi:hypothetical protein